MSCLRRISRQRLYAAEPCPPLCQMQLPPSSPDSDTWVHLVPCSLWHPGQADPPPYQRLQGMKVAPSRALGSPLSSSLCSRLAASILLM